MLLAEIGVNHEGSIDLAKKLIDLATEGGANAAKFQTYKAKNLASKKFSKLLGYIKRIYEISI